MGKRKPDPDVQRLVLKNVPSDIMYLFRHMAESDIDHQHDQFGAFKKLPKQEREQALTEYFVRIIKQHATANMGENLVISHLTDYHLDQRRLKNKIEVQKVTPIHPDITK